MLRTSSLLHISGSRRKGKNEREDDDSMTIFSELRDSIQEQLLGLVKDVFGYDAKRARSLISELVKIAAETNLVREFVCPVDLPPFSFSKHSFS